MAKKDKKAKAEGGIPRDVKRAMKIHGEFFKWVGSPAMFDDIDQKRLLLAYHGSKAVTRRLDGLGNVAKGNSSLEVFLRNACIPFTSAPANDGEIIRLFTALGDEASRFFISRRGKYQGMFGVSGKVRTALEGHAPDDDWAWVQQGSKNYFFSSNFKGLYSYLETLRP